MGTTLSDDDQSSLALGKAAIMRGNLGEAVQYLRSAVRAAPRSPVAKALLADTLLDRGSEADAEQLYLQILDAHPEHPHALLGLGKLSLSRGENEVADGYFRRALDAAFSDGGKLLSLANQLGKLGRTELARSAYAEAAEDPRSDIRDRAAQALLVFDQNLKLKLARQLCLQDADWLKRGRAQFAGSFTADHPEISRAESLLNEVLHSATGSQKSKALALIGHISRMRGDWQAALKNFEAASAADPGNVNLKVEVGDCRRDLGDLDGAEQQYRTALALQADSAEALSALGAIAKLRGDTEAAVEYFNRAARQSPDKLATLTALRSAPLSGGTVDWKAEIKSAIRIVNDSSAQNQLIRAANLLLQYGLTEALRPAISRLEASPQGRQIAASVRELERNGLSQRTTPDGTFADSDLNEIRGYIEKPTQGADTLITVFAGSNHRVAIEFSLLHRILRKLGVSALYVRDVAESRYLRGIVGLGEDFESTAAALRQKMKEFGAKRLLMIGNCEGAPGAVRYAIATGADAALGINPNIGSPSTEGLRPIDAQRLGQLRAQFSGTMPLAEVYRTATHKPKVTFVYAEDHEPYASRVREMGQLEGVTLAGIPHPSLSVGRMLLAGGVLQPLLNEFVSQGALSTGLIRSISDLR